MELIETDRGKHGEGLVSFHLRNRCADCIYGSICMNKTGGKKPSCEAMEMRGGQTSWHYTWESSGTFTYDAVFSIQPAKDWVCHGLDRR